MRKKAGKAWFICFIFWCVLTKHSLLVLSGQNLFIQKNLFIQAVKGNRLRTCYMYEEKQPRSSRPPKANLEGAGMCADSWHSRLKHNCWFHSAGQGSGKITCFLQLNSLSRSCSSLLVKILNSKNWIALRIFWKVGFGIGNSEKMCFHIKSPPVTQCKIFMLAFPRSKPSCSHPPTLGFIYSAILTQLFFLAVLLSRSVK